ncbi:hypothetical protein JMM61_14635 [Rhodovulum sulfidophilum]|uniref:hypothetical protein n=1 Tax=Rhodovulum sulfidophilum TaxID=35806 RepID=UPI0019282EE6|nr:hypothetical protein [Rhodovulum sulfidophilum]MBL3586610.1 hypothetical protein [Rhodovulum sulfidophilum]
MVEAYLDSDFHAPRAKPADPFFLARAAQSLNVPGLEFRKAAAHTDGMARRSIGEAPRAGDASRQAMTAHMAQAWTSPLGISQTPPAKGFSRMTGAQA